MPKVKTHKGTSKRFKSSKNGKISHMSSGQGHFNSRENGKVKRNKRRDSALAKQSTDIKKLVPYI